MPTEPDPSLDADALFARIADRAPIDRAALGADADPALARALALARLLDGVAEAASTPASGPRRIDQGTDAQVGPYRLLRLLGEGGMGEVWLGERCDGQVDQRVAIKRVRGAARVSMLRHLLRERRILARLSHPNIAHFLGADVDAGGEPYLVLEYVEGIALDRYCRERRLSTTPILQLMLAVCDAVAHAHRHLVVHRDLKPANVLVTAEGVPKLLDFGIARLLEDSGNAATHTGLQALTPRYAAPEQFAGDEVTPAIDQYALALMLYELLTGTLPSARGEGHVARIAAALEQADPPLASSSVVAAADSTLTAAATLRGDLDAILARALRRDPLQRYASVADFAADLRRHLAGEVVLARGDATAYRLRRFLQRHRWAAIGVALATTAILTALTVALVQARHAREQALAAESARAGSEAVNAFLTDLLAAPADLSRGADTRVTDLLALAAQRVPSDPSLSRAQRIALHGVLARSFDSLDQDESARREAEAALALAGADPAQQSQRRALLQMLLQSASIRCREADTKHWMQQLEASAHTDLRDTAEVLIARARLADCREDYDTQRNEAASAMALVANDAAALGSWAAAAEQRGRAELALGDPAAAATTLRTALARLPDDVAAAPRRLAIRQILLQTVGMQGDLAAAETIARENLSLLEARHGRAPHPNTLAVRGALAAVLFDRGDFAAALTEGEHAIADATALYGATSPAVSNLRGNRANALKALGRAAEAEAEYRTAIAALATAPLEAGNEEQRLIAAFNLLELLNEGERWQEAHAHGEALLAEAEHVLGREHIVTLETRDALGVTALGRGDAAQAEALHRDALTAKRKTLGDDSPYTASAHHRLGLALIALHRTEDARRELEAALATRRAALGADHPDTRAAAEAVARMPR